MKKTLFFMLTLMCVLFASAQETVTLKFSSTTPDGSYFPFDVVNITNVTRSWTESLTYPDTTMVLTSYDGLQENIYQEGFISEVYPNPLSGTAYVYFEMCKSGLLSAKILSINGSVLSEYTEFIEEGSHKIIINMSKPQMAFLVLRTNDNQYIKKVLNIDSGSSDNISINKVSDIKRNPKTRDSGEFVIGDIMSYMAVSFVGNNMIESNRITQAQYNDETIVLTFPITSPSVSTAEITNISINTAIAGGVVLTDGGGTVSARGVCWSTSQNPAINDNHTNDGNGLGSFISNITELSANTTYYVRAYATNNVGTAYGSEVSFTTESEQIWPNGVLPGLFSVSPTQQVHFSQGNLQYQASTNTWKFADNQYDYVGSSNSNISSSYSGWIDLFGWGTSGYNHGANCYQPWSTSQSCSDYYAYGNYQNNLYDQTGEADWGYNPISNGGNQANQWRTLTQPEWNYMFNTRTTTSGIRYAKANVNNINGVILLPDDWSSSTYSLSNTNSSGASFSSNTISASQWTTLESAGAVFLPAAGIREGSSFSVVGPYGSYWSASYSDSYNAYYVDFSEVYLNVYDYYRYSGRGVRLVRVAE